MSYVHLKPKDHYENILDRLTVERGRRNQTSFVKIYDEFFKKFPDEDPKRHGVVLHFNIIYMAMVGNELLDRYDRRESHVLEMMAKDESKDEQLATARLSSEPVCQHCGEVGLRIISKDLMHRGDNYEHDRPEEVLFMLRCTSCQKNSAYWEDGTAWEHRNVNCPKCKAVMQEEGSRKAKVITTTYTCPACGHSYKDRLDFNVKGKKIDPDFEKDRAIFCLLDDKIRDELRESRHRFEEMARWGKELKEKEDNKHIYDAMAELKRPKIAELLPLLAPTLEKAGYTELSLDKPEIGRDVYIGFSCLDSRSEREDYESRKVLKKLIDKALSDTNWRLMSDCVGYRLGYLSGRLRAYEQEEDIRSLVIRTQKLKPKKGPSS